VQGDSTGDGRTPDGWPLSLIWGILPSAMARARNRIAKKKAPAALAGYDDLFADVALVIEEARRTAARSVNAVMTATYWLVGCRIVQHEQGGKARAGYGEALLERLSADLTVRFGRGFSVDNLETMRLFFQTYSNPDPEKSETLSRKSAIGKTETLSRESELANVASRFRLSWSHYVLLVRSRSAQAREFYEAEALRGGWTVRQLRRQIDSQFYERTALSRNKAAVLRKGAVGKPEDAVAPEEEIKSPYVLEFLGLKDEYSETDLEAALIARLESFLLELGDDFTFVGRQRRLRLDDVWYRVDLLFFHRTLRCLVVIDLKLGKLTHADVGQMHLYLNYAREHWGRPGENPPVGLILCAGKREAVARYALEGLRNKILASEYLTTLPQEEKIAAELKHTRQVLEERKRLPSKRPGGARRKRKSKTK
jgi:predicted nuclease of restriction endonuclease-like (RecB) superfamily